MTLLLILLVLSILLVLGATARTFLHVRRQIRVPDNPLTDAMAELDDERQVSHV